MLRTVIIGKNRRVAIEVHAQLKKNRGIDAMKCPATKEGLLDVAIKWMPHVVIVCMKNEKREEAGIYDVLRDCEKIGATEVIVVADEGDRDLFMRITKLTKMYFLDRPLSITALLSKIDEIQKKVDAKKEDEGNPLLKEYINPDTVEVYDRKHILVIDDDPEQLANIKGYLKEFYEVTLVGSGKNAFKYMEKYKVDLILLDYMMPEMDGAEVFRQIREFPSYKDVPVVFLTGVCDREIVRKILVDLNPQGYVLKPVKKSELVSKIIDVLELYGSNTN